MARNSLPSMSNINNWRFWIYLYAEDPYEAKYQLLINKGESTG